MLRLASMLARLALLLHLAFAPLACASDAVDAPEPTLETPGSFVARQEPSGEIRLFRVMQVLTLETGQTMLIMIMYAPRPASFTEAKSLAEDRDLAVQQLTYAVESEFAKAPLQIVWFRTLTPQERGL